MSDLSFDNNRDLPSYDRFATTKIPPIQRFLISSGLVKDEQKADKLLIIISITLILCAIAFLIFKTRTPHIKVIHLQPRPIVETSATSTMR